MGARNLHRICRSASLNSSFIMMCWLTPKFLPGSSENFDMLRSGFSSQSALAGLDFWELSLDEDFGVKELGELAVDEPFALEVGSALEFDAPDDFASFLPSSLRIW